MIPTRYIALVAFLSSLISSVSFASCEIDISEVEDGFVKAKSCPIWPDDLREDKMRLYLSYLVDRDKNTLRLTQEDLASALGVSQPSIGRFLSGSSVTVVSSGLMEYYRDGKTPLSKIKKDSGLDFLGNIFQALNFMHSWASRPKAPAHYIALSSVDEGVIGITAITEESKKTR